MAHGHFLWADLSTFRLDVTLAFYERYLGWTFSNDAYHIASTEIGPVAALYRMPDKFQAIRMPSFWMSYIGVENVNTAVGLAADNGGKVELGPEPFEGGGQFALIRDPLGAGFTVYEGRAVSGVIAGPGARVGHGLFVSDAAAVRPFYAALFGWSFDHISDAVWAIRSGPETLGHLHHIPDPALRGKEEYWAILFSGQARDVGALGGTEIAHVMLPEGEARLVCDPDGAAFFVLDADAHSP